MSPATHGVQPSTTLSALNSVQHILTAHSNQALSAIDKFYPYRYRDQLTQEGLADLQAKLLEKWRGLKGRTQMDCVRIYLTCSRKWPYFGATLFQVPARCFPTASIKSNSCVAGKVTSTRFSNELVGGQRGRHHGVGSSNDAATGQVPLHKRVDFRWMSGGFHVGGDSERPSAIAEIDILAEQAEDTGTHVAHC